MQKGLKQDEDDNQPPPVKLFTAVPCPDKLVCNPYANCSAIWEKVWKKLTLKQKTTYFFNNKIFIYKYRE